MTIDITARFGGNVLFTLDDDGATLRAAVEKAVSVRAKLCGADLYGANLRNADLCNADLRSADLRGANLRSADLRGANLRSANLRDADLCDANLCGADLCDVNLYSADLCGANLCRADLCGANLYGAHLYGANLRSANLRDGCILVGSRPCLSIGPIGSRCDTLRAWLTDKGVYIVAGCFFGTRDEFAARVNESHGDNEHAREYGAALVLIDAHAREWMPAGPV